MKEVKRDKRGRWEVTSWDEAKLGGVSGRPLFGFSLLTLLPLLREAPRGWAWQQTTSSATEITRLHLSIRCLHSDGSGVRVDQRACQLCGGGRGWLQAEPVRSDGPECGLWCGAVQHRWVTTATIVFFLISYIHRKYQQLSCVCRSAGFDIFFFMLLSQFAQSPERIETFHSSGSTTFVQHWKIAAERVCDFRKASPPGKQNHVPKLFVSRQFRYGSGWSVRRPRFIISPMADACL